MKDIVRLNEIKPLQAEGRCTIELTDPITGKVKERVCGENMVFPETLMLDAWWNILDLAYTVLGDDDTPSSLDFPYMRGKALGYGVPSTGGSGTKRGAYNASNQILKKASDGKLSWKFQYDFTAPQALGTIKAVSLTRQYNEYGNARSRLTQFYSPTNTTHSYYDGQYGYLVSVAGVVTITNMYFGTAQTIDISAKVGATSNKSIFIDKTTGTVYILKSVSDTNHTLYKFTDKTFATLSNTYTLTSPRVNSSRLFLIKGDYIYWAANATDTKLTKINYITDTVADTISCIGGDIFGLYVPATYLLTLVYLNNGCILLFYQLSNSYIRHEIFDLNTEKFVAGFHTYYGSTISIVNHYYAEHPLPCFASGQHAVLPTAFTNYVLPTPVEKTNDKGMTVTYELDVYW